MRTYLYIALLLALATGLSAQTDTGPIVFSQTGEAKFIASPESEVVMVEPGTELSMDGTLLIEQGELGIYHQEKYTYIKGPALVSLRNEMTSANTNQSRLVNHLGEQLVDAINPYFRNSSAGLGGDDGEGDPPARPSRPGHGNRDAKIAPVAPYPGRLHGNNIVFHWKPIEGVTAGDGYTLVLMDEDEEPIREIAVSGTTHTLPVADLGLEADGIYLWEVTSTDQADVNTGTLEFSYANEYITNNLMTRLQEDPGYRQASPAAKLLLKAATMESAEFYTDAYDTLRIAEKLFPDDSLVTWMKNLFIWRNDQ